jgi:DNA repair protein RadC
MDTLNATLRAVPNEERPRERMLQFGAHALSNAELLAILLRTGTFNESAVSLAQKVLSECGGLRHLVNLSTEQLTGIKGIGMAKALQIQAGIELGKRLSRSTLHEPTVIRSPKDVAEYLMEEMRYLQKEHFVCLFLNTKNHILAKETISVGTLDASIVHPRDVFRSAINRNSSSVICAHNHPSGDPQPSQEDIKVTRRLVESGEIVGIEVLDHIVIGDRKFVSLKEQGLM